MSLIKKIYNWEYGYDNMRYEFIIVPNKKIEKPKTLFKYYPLSENSIDAVTHNYLYATHPNQLNDIYDCAADMIVYDNVEMNRKELAALDLINQQQSEDQLLYDKQVISGVRRGLWQSMYSKIGIVSFTSNNNNLLMWSQYAKNCGFCVEFNYHTFPFKYYGPFPINYQSQIKELRLSEIPFEIAVAVQFSVKNKCWEHEEEWRIIPVVTDGVDMQVFGDGLDSMGGGERKFRFPKTSIVQIGLGPTFFLKEELQFYNNYEQAKIVFSSSRDDSELREKLLVWCRLNNVTINLPLPIKMSAIHYVTATIGSNDTALILNILDRIID